MTYLFVPFAFHLKIQTISKMIYYQIYIMICSSFRLKIQSLSWLVTSMLEHLIMGFTAQLQGANSRQQIFFNDLMKYDISIISETWGCKHPIFLSGYNFYKINPNKYKKIKSGRSSGGIIVFYRKSLQNKLILIKSTKHYLWMKLNDLFICTVCIPPENSSYFEDDILSNIHNDMLQFQAENSKFVMVGDFNARTSNHGLHCPTTGCKLQTTDFFQ